MTGTVLSVDALARKSQELQKQGKRVVLCHGVFDLLHIGHIRYLRGARELGDALMVTVTPDRFVDKGPHRPAFPEQLRVEAIASLDCVDFAAVNEWPTAEETLRLVRPNIYAKGAEFKNLEDRTGKIAREKTVVEEIGAQIAFVEDIVFSSSNLINRYLSSVPDDCREYLQQFRQRWPLKSVLQHLDAFKELKVLVVGDMILDEYVYCSALGASSKDPVLAVRYLSKEVYAGGSAAIANHIAQHAAKVTLCTVIGDDGHEAFIREHLAPGVNFRPVVRQGAPTVRKQRIMDGYCFQKLVEVYHMDESPLPKDLDEKFIASVQALFAEHDLVVAADFGHGCIGDELVPVLCDAPYLAVNTQANAGNRGYHTISKYPKADFISLAGHEVTLEYRNKKLSTGEMMENLKKRLQARAVLVTEGRRGCAVLQDDFVRAPSFATRVVDRVGAGDALFSVTSMAAFLDFPPDLTAFLGNIAGGLAVESIGNAKAVSREGMERFITSLMK